ncbi:MAG: hypothetical protein MIO93_03015 [ANME-2 cluster archaeon]|jgi:hypothetical protein|nr:hypothetical protein [ANME-2 cluster archaeon]
MEINSATIVEMLNMGMGICIVLISYYAAKKFSILVFRRGWFLVSFSGAVMVLGSIFRAYYSFIGLYEEWAWLGRIFVFIHLFVLVIGIYLLAMTAVKMWGDE